ncbi:MAG: NADH-quinone oxidoreductase subunit L [Verrucomicrobiota bacterium]|nr:NADH-quinone oxidoreductase subunit L [Verrucomicrobiota bacterium]
MEQLENSAWIVLLLPLFSAVVITLFTRRSGRVSALISIAAVLGAFLITLGLIPLVRQSGFVKVPPLNWISVGDFRIELGLLLDRLSMLMLIVVTGVASLIHIYSYAYMKGDPAFSRYFASLSLFTFSMLGIVLSNNFFQMFIFWELVGISSYLLIGFWHGKASAANAAKKAFLANRIGDFGFLLGIIIIWTLLGSVNFDHVEQRLITNPAALGAFAGLVGLLIFCGALGKSAQFPLHVWLPDAMEGPTPVSALIHAATMVAAGIYMLCRTFFIYQASSAWPEFLSFMNGITALEIIAWSGGITALLAALIAVQQNDIKRIPAYSTLSQLGYMTMAVGLGGTSAAMYHLTTHAFFKAMLFLGAGSVIHAMHHEQDIWRMGGLKKKMPLTYWTFLLGTLALAGVPPLSGFYSKDAILAKAYEQHTGFFILGLIVAVLTTFYMARLFIIAFLGNGRSNSAAHAHESPRLMTVPLLVLAVPTVLAGFFGLESYLSKDASHAHGGGINELLFGPINHAPFAALGGILAVVFGLFLAAGLYLNANRDPLPLKARGLARTLRNRFYIDEIYGELIDLTQGTLARLADWFDRWIISGLLVRGVHGTTEFAGRALRLAQTGNLQTYAFLLAAGIALLLLLVFKP